MFYIFLAWFSLAFGVTELKVLCYWCPFYKVRGSSKKHPPIPISDTILFTT